MVRFMRTEVVRPVVAVVDGLVTILGRMLTPWLLAVELFVMAWLLPYQEERF